MKILHTSDLHLGHRLLERSRMEEQARLLDWLAELIEAEGVELVLIAGDIFDTGSPPNGALALYYDFLSRIAATNVLGTVVIGGNHDSATMLNAPRTVLRRFRVHVVGGGGEPENERFVVRDAAGEPLAAVAAVPFLRERELRTPRPGEAWEERDAALSSALAERYRLAARSKPETAGLPLIMTGHLFAGGKSGGGERDLYVGSLGQVDASVFPDEAAYVALGHLHRAQAVGGEDRIRYSGSPLALDFGDESEKGVVIVELDGAEFRGAEFVPAPVFRRLVSLAGPLTEILWRLNDEAGRGEEFTPWLDITVTDSVGEAQERIEEAAAALELEVLRVRNSRGAGAEAWEEVDVQLEELTPEEVFRRRCESRGEEPDDELLRAFGELATQAAALLAEEEGEERE